MSNFQRQKIKVPRSARLQGILSRRFARTPTIEASALGIKPIVRLRLGRHERLRSARLSRRSSLVGIKKGQTGFSLIELLVVVAIFFIISSVTLFKQSKFSSDILITNTAYDVALAIREAQVYGVGSRQGDPDINLQNDEERRKSYGVSFYFDENAATSANEFILFSERINPDLKSYDSLYDPGNTTKYVEVNRVKLQREQTIDDFCASVSGGPLKCALTTDRGNIKRLNIAFIKPNLNAVIKTEQPGGGFDVYNNAHIIIRSSLGDKCRTINVSSAGQVSIAPVPPGETGCEVD